MNLLRGLFRDLIAILPEKRDDILISRKLDSKLSTVVFVSGFGAPQRGLRIMQRRLIRDGHNVTMFSLHWQDMNGGIPEMARLLGVEILRIKKLIPGSPIHLVAHSAGGIVARYYVQILGGSHYVETLTTLATPHHGTWLTLLGFLSHLALLGRCLIQLSPRSSLLIKLNAAPMPADVRMISISSIDDIICRSVSTKIPPALSVCKNVRSVEVKGLSHSDFVLSKRGYRVLQRVLRGWKSQSPDDVFAAVHS